MPLYGPYESLLLIFYNEELFPSFCVPSSYSPPLCLYGWDIYLAISPSPGLETQAPYRLGEYVLYLDYTETDVFPPASFIVEPVLGFFTYSVCALFLCPEPPLFWSHRPSGFLCPSFYTLRGFLFFLHSFLAPCFFRPVLPVSME